jgi:hypothetical protein
MIKRVMAGHLLAYVVSTLTTQLILDKTTYLDKAYDKLADKMVEKTEARAASKHRVPTATTRMSGGPLG